MSRTALVIDNDDTTVSQIDSALSGIGYTVTGAADAETGLSQAGSSQPSIMLVNLATPGSNGLELCKTIHSTETLKEVPIILLTLREGKFDPVYVKLYGIVAFLKKPFEDSALLELVNEHSIAPEEPEPSEPEPEEPAAEPEVVMGFDEEATAFEEPAAVEDESAMAFEEPAAIEDESAMAFEEPSMDDADATMTMSVESEEDEAVSVEAEDADTTFGETVTLEGAEGLGDLADSFADSDYQEDAATEADDGSIEISSTLETDEPDDIAEDTEEPSEWGALGTPMGMEDDSQDDSSEEAWGMGGDMSMDTFGQDDESESGAGVEDAFGAADDATSDAGEGFDAEGTMALDAGGEDAFSAGGDATSDAGDGFDSEGTMTFDSTAAEGFGTEDTGEDLDMGGFKASKDVQAPASEDMAIASAEDEQGAWGDSSVESEAATDDGLASAFDDEEEAFSSGFDDDDEGFGDTEDAFGETEDVFAGAEDAFGETEDAGAVEQEAQADAGDAALDEGFGEESAQAPAETDSDFAGDDQDYTGLFDAVDEEGDEEGQKGKKKKKKGFKKGKTSKLVKALLLLVVLGLIGGGGFYFRDMLPQDLLDSIPFIGKKDTTLAKKPVAKRVPKPAPRKDTAPSKPEPKPVTPEKEAKAPVKPEPVKKEPVAPKEEVQKAPKKTVKKAPKPATAAPAAGFKKGMHYVQFGVFGKQNNADRLSAQLKKKGYATLQTKIKGKKGRALTVVLLDTPFKTRASAQKKGRQITKATGFDTAVYK